MNLISVSSPFFLFSFELVGNLIQKSNTHITLAHYQSTHHLKNTQRTPYCKAKIIVLESERRIFEPYLYHVLTILGKLFNQQFSHL